MTTTRSVLVLKASICLALWTSATWVVADSPAGNAAATNGSLITNGGFENWQPAPDNLSKAMDCLQVPTGWTVIERNPLEKCYSLQCDAAVKHGGACSVRLQSTDSKGRLILAQRVDAEPQYRYKFSVWLKGDHIDAYSPKGITLLVIASSISDKTNTSLWDGALLTPKDEYKQPSPSNGTFDWHEFVFTLDTPVNTKTILFWVDFTGAGTLWLDDVQITRLEKCLQVESY